MSRNLSDLIAPVYKTFNQSIDTGAHDHYWIYGGRGSAKSSAISIEILKEMMQEKNRNKHALVLRKHANTLAQSVFTQMLWACEKLDMLQFVQKRMTPLKLILPTGQTIFFHGLDDPLKLKSIKTQRGYIGYIWYEEVTEITPEDIRSVNQSTMRGGDKFSVFYSYNPSKFASHWVNQAVNIPHERKFSLKTTYLDIPRNWLGETFYQEAEILRQSNPMAYSNEYLGEVTGGGGQIFNNLQTRVIPKEERDRMIDRIFVGMDFGFAVSPLVILVAGYNKTTNTVYIIDEYSGRNISNEQCFDKIKEIWKKHNLPSTTVIYADCAEPKSISFFKQRGVPILPCTKGADSIRHGVHFLQDLAQIQIDSTDCPLSAAQFTMYEYQKNRMDEWIDEYPTKNDDTIDALRYALQPIALPIISAFSV